MTGYTKLFSSIIHSTIWQEPLEIKVVWITMLAMKDRDGNVLCSIPGLAKSAGVTIEQCEIALEHFRKPDRYSSTKNHEGRRIKDVDGGWFVLNHYKYQEAMNLEDRRAYWALKQREGRARKNAVNRKIKKRENQTMDLAEDVPEFEDVSEDELRQRLWEEGLTEEQIEYRIAKLSGNGEQQP